MKNKRKIKAESYAPQQDPVVRNEGPCTTEGRNFGSGGSNGQVSGRAPLAIFSPKNTMPSTTTRTQKHTKPHTHTHAYSQIYTHIHDKRVVEKERERKEYYE